METDLPRLVLHEQAISHNLGVMAAYCARAGVLLAPHAKTHMVRELCQRQLDAGAWGLTAATTAQVRQLTAWGAPRILHANVLVDADAIRWVATTFLGAEGRTGALGDSAGEYFCYLDSPSGLALLEAELRAAGARTPLNIFVEVGFAGGRTGVRDPADALQLARAVAGSPWLSLTGVAGFEGLMPDRSSVQSLLTDIHGLVVACHDEGLFTGVPIVTAGGSSYFDSVVEALTPDRFDFAVRTVLRSGCYLTHDHGIYERTSPIAGELVPALELRASVLSQPEPELVIVGFGRREAPTDDRLPVALGETSGVQRDAAVGAAGFGHGGFGRSGFGRSGFGRAAEPGWTVVAVNDHHAYLRVPAGTTLTPGTVLSFGISHPCGAFDRWRRIPLLDEGGTVIDVLEPAL